MTELIVVRYEYQTSWGEWKADKASFWMGEESTETFLTDVFRTLISRRKCKVRNIRFASRQ